MELRDNGMCFACGPKNQIGLKLEFEFENGRYVTRFTPGPEHQGFEGITHGGILTTLLDEAMARLVWVKGYRALTAEMQIRLRKPAATGEELTVMGWMLRDSRRMIDCMAEARDPGGELVADAEAKMIKV